MKRFTVAVYPSVNAHPYLKCLYENLEEYVIVKDLINVNNLGQTFHVILNAKIFHFHWVETTYRGKFSLLRILFFYLFLFPFIKISNKKLIVTAHNVLPHKYNDYDFLWFRLFFHVVNGVIVHNKWSKEYLIEFYGISESKIIIIPIGNFIHYYLKFIRDSSYRYNFPLDRKVILFFGGLREDKGILEWLNFIDKYLSETNTSRFFFVIAGVPENDTIRQKLINLKNRYPQDMYVFASFIPEEELPLLIKASDYLIFPYKSITTSAAIITGAGLKKLCITTKLPPIYELLGEDGCYLSGLDYFSFKTMLERILVFDKQTLHRMMLRQYLRVKALSWKKISKKTYLYYLYLTCPSHSFNTSL